jgi:glycosyltransferase involved in cell wall biosynthesis
VKIKVIWIIDSLGQGGAEHLMPGILGHMDRSRFDLRVCALQERFGNPIAVKIKELGIPVDMVSIPHLRTPGALENLRAYLREHNPDVVHTQLEFSDTLGSLAARLEHIPSVSTMHVIPEPSMRSREFWRHRLMWMSLKYCSRRVFAVSEGARRHYISSGGLPPARVQTLYNGIDLTRYAVDDRQRTLKRADFGLPDGAPVLVTVAYLREPKGIQYMLEALPDVRKRFPECRYLIVGDGDFRPVLEAQTRDLGLVRNVIFTGQRSDIPDVLAVSNIFVLPTLTEALPTVLAEAMAAQKPIIASAVGGVPEMVEDGRNGLLVPPSDPRKLANAVISLLDNPERAAAMGKTGAAIAAEKFDIDRQCRQLEACYSELAAESKKGR